jgi:hypothetical protein
VCVCVKQTSIWVSLIWEENFIVQNSKPFDINTMVTWTVNQDTVCCRFIMCFFYILILKLFFNDLVFLWPKWKPIDSNLLRNDKIKRKRPKIIYTDKIEDNFEIGSRSSLWFNHYFQMMNFKSFNILKF